MDPELHSDDEYTSPSVTDEQEFTSHGGGMFAGSQNFVVAGGTFTNLTTNYVTAPAVPTDLRMIPLGDIDLQQQLVVESGSGVIGRTWERRYVRRVYSAKLRGRQSNVTVAMYQGDGAEEDWREDIERYMNLRHPNIVQVCGGARHGNIHATVFHGDLVPLKQYMARRSPIMTVYLYAYFSHELTVLTTRFGSVAQPADSSRHSPQGSTNASHRTTITFVSGLSVSGAAPISLHPRQSALEQLSALGIMPMPRSSQPRLTWMSSWVSSSGGETIGTAWRRMRMRRKRMRMRRKRMRRMVLKTGGPGTKPTMYSTLSSQSQCPGNGQGHLPVPG
ncbi:hypothetical protein C8R46DRAFT_1092894 [Mycena filopes]|nr:hypothetical protein C8R46DRAFT_1092894 [Mycena filopes]